MGAVKGVVESKSGSGCAYIRLDQGGRASLTATLTKSAPVVKRKRVAVISQLTRTFLSLRDEMSQPTSDQDASVLGKRVHDGSPQKPDDDTTPGPAEDDDDEDDIGPMPMPADAPSNGGVRKKRKGLFIVVYSHGVT